MTSPLTALTGILKKRRAQERYHRIITHHHLLACLFLVKLPVYPMAAYALLALLLLALAQEIQSFLPPRPTTQSFRQSRIGSLTQRDTSLKLRARWRNIPEEGCESDEYLLTVLGK